MYLITYRYIEISEINCKIDQKEKKLQQIKQTIGGVVQDWDINQKNDKPKIWFVRVNQSNARFFIPEYPNK